MARAQGLLSVFLLATAGALGVALVTLALGSWTWADLPRGVALGLLAGLFGVSLFWAGYTLAERAPAAQSAEGPTPPPGPPSRAVSPEEAKKWLQTFLREQQKGE